MQHFSQSQYSGSERSRVLSQFKVLHQSQADSTLTSDHLAEAWRSLRGKEVRALAIELSKYLDRAKANLSEEFFNAITTLAQDLVSFQYYEEAELVLIELTEQSRVVSELFFGRANIQLGELYLSWNKNDHAQTAFESARVLLQVVTADNKLDFLDSLDSLAMLYMDKGHVAAAEACHDEILDICNTTSKRNAPEVVFAMNDLLRREVGGGQTDRIESLAFNLLGRVGNEKSFSKVKGYALIVLADLYQNQGASDLANSLYNQALSCYEQVGIKLFPGDIQVLGRLRSQLANAS